MTYNKYNILINNFIINNFIIYDNISIIVEDTKSNSHL